jgi:hypothetical protein
MIYIGGCSISTGAGFEQEQVDARIYPNLLAQALKMDVINDAEGGSSNLKIFLRTCKALIDNQCEIFVVQWTAIHRHWLYPTPDSGLFIGTPLESGDDTRFVAEFQKRNHDYGNIMQLIDFCRIIQDIAKCKNKKVVFINGRIDMTPDMADSSLPMSTEFENLLCDLKKEQRANFAQQLVNNFELVDWKSWANPWQSVANMQTDKAPMDAHPGPDTHAKLVKLILERIDT